MDYPNFGVETRSLNKEDGYLCNFLVVGDFARCSYDGEASSELIFIIVL